MKRLIGRDFLDTADFTKDDLTTMLRRAAEMKSEDRHRKRFTACLKGKSIALLFQKPSTRTRISFDVGVHQLGGHPIYLGWNELQLGRGETVADTGRTFDRFVDGIVARVFKHSDLETIAQAARAPVINALSDTLHPCQAMADCLTVMEKKGRIEGINFTFVGDGNSNVCRSLTKLVLQLGGNMTIASPRVFMPPEEFVRSAKALSSGGARLELTESPDEAVKGADVVYTDVWVSMGQESESDARRAMLQPYRLSAQLMTAAPSDAMVMHCLPAHRGEEITDDVIDGKSSVVWEQAENRLHVQKGIMSLLF